MTGIRQNVILLCATSKCMFSATQNMWAAPSVSEISADPFRCPTAVYLTSDRFVQFAELSAVGQSGAVTAVGLCDRPPLFLPEDTNA